MDGAFRLPRLSSLCPLSSDGGRSRKIQGGSLAMSVGIYQTILRRRGGVQPARHAIETGRLRLHTPYAPWWPVVAGRSAPARQQCGRTVVAPPVISLFDPQCILLGACIWPGSALCEGAVCSIHPPGSLIEIKTIIAPITLPLHRVFGPVQR